MFTIHGTDKMQVCLPLVTSEYNQLNENLNALRAEEVPRRTSTASCPSSCASTAWGLSTWKGRIARLDQSEAKFVPLPLSSRAGGPVPVHPPSGKTPGLVPQTQHYLVYIDIANPDPAITVGSMAQVKIRLPPRDVPALGRGARSTTCSTCGCCEAWGAAVTPVCG